ncbi:MAG: type 2 isopentenyl-diphosphate Delta-isomerase [Anaerococcus sp.]|nr:type 2 isopentenyl-diphosphate Delta-isomerase [Anaerococcus sp.]
MTDMRNQRKDEHIENYLKSEILTDTLFKDVYLEHVALADISINQIDTSMDFLGKKLSMPLLINAMTGGGEVGWDINEDLSSICQELGLAMAVGSEAIAIDDESSRESFSLMKDKDLVRIGNLGAEKSLEDYIFAKDLIDAHMMQVHLNMAQELVMGEGDKDFRSWRSNIKSLVENLDLPIMVKETGCGISARVAKDLLAMGVKYIDISGKGGTNFIEIEDLRDVDKDFSDFYDWGIPTAKAIIDIRKISDEAFIIASGGIRTALDIAKALALGADMVAISGEVLRYLLHGGYHAAEEYLKDLNHKFKIIMCLLGVKNIEELKKVDYKLVGRLKELVE